MGTSNSPSPKIHLAQIKKAWRRLKKIYDELPEVECTGKCADQCSVIPLEPCENVMLKHFHGKMIRNKTWGDSCDFLDEGRCAAHEHRPLICRVFGTAEGLLCPHGCKVIGKPLTRERVYYLMDKVCDISQQLGLEGTGQDCLPDL